MKTLLSSRCARLPRSAFDDTASLSLSLSLYLSVSGIINVTWLLHCRDLRDVWMRPLHPVVLRRFPPGWVESG